MREFKVLQKEPERVNAYLRDQGVGSRRTIDAYIEKGYVFINGKKATLGSKVEKGDEVQVRAPQKDLLYALYYKPQTIS